MLVVEQDANTEQVALLSETAEKLVGQAANSNVSFCARQKTKERIT